MKLALHPPKRRNQSSLRPAAPVFPRRIASVTVVLLGTLATPKAEDAPRLATVRIESSHPAGFGAEVNPTGQPVGGGAGYTKGPKRDDATQVAGTIGELIEALAAAAAGEVIWIASGSVIDFTGTSIEVPEDVTLAGDRGQAGAEGPLLTTKYTDSEYFILLRPGSRLTGVRVRGSNPPMKDIDMQESDPSGYAVSCANAEVDNCEVSRFRRAGIAMFRDSDHSHIHHNHIRDIAAYPVFLGNGTGDGHLIEANRIEWAWHAVASNGSRGSGYTARYNIFVRVPRPKLFDQSGPDPPNWCLDTHTNLGAETSPPRPATRKLVAHHNTFLAHPEVRVGNGSELIQSVGAYPKHDIYIGAGVGMTTTVEIHRNRFLMHETAGSPHPAKPYGRAVRLVGLKGHPELPDDPGPSEDDWMVTLGENRYGGPE